MGEVDYYDVQSMIRDARSEIRGEIDNAVRDACRELREELTYEITRREEQIESLWRVLNERTGNLV